MWIQKPPLLPVVPVPLHWGEQVKADLERDVRIGVLEKVPDITPVTWYSRIVITSKANGDPRRTIDFQPLNKHCKRQTFPLDSPFNLQEEKCIRCMERLSLHPTPPCPSPLYHLPRPFREGKKAIVDNIIEGVHLFNPTLPTCLATDLYGLGIGFFLLQTSCSCSLRLPACCPTGWRLCLVGISFLHPS